MDITRMRLGLKDCKIFVGCGLMEGCEYLISSALSAIDTLIYLLLCGFGVFVSQSRDCIAFRSVVRGYEWLIGLARKRLWVKVRRFHISKIVLMDGGTFRFVYIKGAETS